jgi:hypothetical protein
LACDEKCNAFFILAGSLTDPEVFICNESGLAQLKDFHHKTYRESVIARRRSRRSNPCLSSPEGLLDGFLLRSAQSQ